MDTTVEEIALVPQNQDNELSNQTKLHHVLDDIQHQTDKHFVLIRLFKSKKHLKTFILWIILFICLLLIAGPLSLHISSSVPSVKTRNIPANIFSEERARDYLNNLTQYGSRVSHTRGNIDARNYLIRQIKQIFSMSKRHLRFELDLQNLTDSDHQQLQNILVRVSNPTTKSNDVSSLMLSAHYDSVEFSSGSCDDGSGVVVLLELLSNLINDVTMNFSDVHLIVLFTNGEEMGLLGAKAFITNHSWRWNIHRFINLDSTTCTESAGLIHIGSSKMIADYSRVPRPRANVILKGILEWLGIRTEYTMYYEIGSLLGYDFGLFIDSYIYHTTLDRPSMIKRGVLQDLGDNLSILIRNILLGNIQKIETVTNTDSLIYFDVLGRYLIMYKTSTSIIIQQILIILIIVVSVILIIFDEIYHRTSCSDQQCIYFHFRKAFSLRIISIILYLIFNSLSVLIGLIFSFIIAWIMSMIDPLSWFGNSTLAIFLFSVPCLIGFTMITYLGDIVHRFILRIYPKNSLENDVTVEINHLNKVKFDFEQNLSIVLIYGLLMIASIYFKGSGFYIILVWSIFICPSYLLLMIIEFIIHWKKIHCNFFEERYHWLFLPLIICLFPLIHTMEVMNRLLGFLIPFLSQRFSSEIWVLTGSIRIWGVIAIPTTLFALIFLPILQRTKYFGRTLIIFLITFSITCIVAYNRQPFSNIHPNTFYAEHRSKSIFEVETLSNVTFIVPLKSQSSSITVMTHNGFAVSPMLDQFSAKSGHILRNKLCSHRAICTFDDTFNRTIAVQNIEIESLKNFTNYKILIRHVLSYNIRIVSSSSIKFIVRNQWVFPRTETIIDVTLNSSLSSFEIDIKIIRCDLTDSPFLLLFTHVMTNLVLVGDGHCQAIDDDIALIIKQPELFNV